MADIISKKDFEARVREVGKFRSDMTPDMQASLINQMYEAVKSGSKIKYHEYFVVIDGVMFAL